MFNPGKALTRIFGSRNDRLLKKYWKDVATINSIEPLVRAMNDTQMRERTQQIRKTFHDDANTKLEDKAGDIDGKPYTYLHLGFALIRESMDRHIGIRQIFNPETNFDPNKLDDAMLQVYDTVQQVMIQTGQSWENVAIPTELYDAVRALYPESRPPFRARCFDVQLIGGLVLFEGRIAEMKTGEGKTFVAPLSCFVKALQNLHSHVVTVNDYLVRRDSLWVKPAFDNLGVTVGFIQQGMDPGGQGRKRQYLCDITYGTSSEFGFDYLRDNMKQRVQDQVQGKLDFAIVDEIDSILIDEARTPLIISGPANAVDPDFKKADEVARKVMEMNKSWDKAQDKIDGINRRIKAAEGDFEKVKGKAEKQKIQQQVTELEKELEAAEAEQSKFTQYYERELDKKSVHLSHEGIAAAQEFAGVGSFYVGDNLEWPHLMEQAMRAHVCYERDKDYVVDVSPRSGEMEVIIVDEFTGRKMVGRQWSDGLHQAVEAKEGVPIKRQTQTLATITLQNFFKLYKGLSGMTGTAQTEAEEFSKIYSLEVVSIPTNRPVVRDDAPDLVFRTEAEKWEAIADEAKEISEQGRPVLVGTTSVEKSEYVSRLLTKKYKLKHDVLNAKQHEREAHIVENAGKQHDENGKMFGNVTIATNMAGRGTDIKPSPEAREAGGLHVLGTERHTARRIDDQLRGRSGRQGDPGSSRFYVSLQDELMKMFAGEWTVNILKRLGLGDGEAIESPMVTKGIQRAQKKVEERNFLSRKNLLEYDEVNDIQRTYFYGERQKVLEGRDIEGVIWDMIGEAVDDAVDRYVVTDYAAATIAEWARNELDINVEPEDFGGKHKKFEDIEDTVRAKASNDIETLVGSTLAEYMGEDPDDSNNWDVKSIAEWSAKKFGIQLNQSDIRRMDDQELSNRLISAAHKRIDDYDLTPIQQFLDPKFPLEQLNGWMEDKFGFTVPVDDMLIDAERGITKPADEIIQVIEDRARQAYSRREAEYPVDHVLQMVFGDADNPQLSPEGLNYLRNWGKAKYDLDLTEEQVQTTPVRDLRDTLIGKQQEFMQDGGIEKAADELHAATGDDAAKISEAFNRKFLQRTTPADFDPAEVKLEEDEQSPTPKDLILRRLRQLFRAELTNLEQYVLISIYDQTWKDHLLAMDMLKGSIGLQAFAERDPRVAFKREGMKYFEEFQKSIRDKVTDLIFRVRVGGGVDKPEPKPEPKTVATHASADESQAHATTDPPVGSDTPTANPSAAASNVANAPKGQGKRQPPKPRNKKGKRK
ncbi:MAG: hypothetical protein AAGD32_01990 [Planctomycetota bacterium]